ncbi:hypothetical protein CDAR_569961 [Caerostris darwini]|uniref:Uncharacterized protein n=1 Tax=Caerostris darwini TaxID=1538125 RepID=A0AAV4S2Y3_9ARAC|nr:hypothetical protein CDAR_569961 [Caerostris darwini]
MTRQDMTMRYNHLEADYIAHVMKQLCSGYNPLSVRCLSLKYVPRPLSKINPSLSLSNARAYITPNRLIHPMLIFRHRQPVGTYLHSPNTKILPPKAFLARLYRGVSISSARCRSSGTLGRKRSFRHQGDFIR